LGDLPGADTVRLSLAKFLADRGRASEAELELLQLIGSSDSATHAEASELLSKLNAKSSRANGVTNVVWPRGHVVGEIVSTAAIDAQTRARMQRPAGDRQSGYRPMRVEQDYAPGFAHLEWFVAADISEIV